MTDYIELTQKDVKELYEFAKRTIADTALNSSIGSPEQRKAMRVFQKNQDERSSLMDYIAYHKRKSKMKNHFIKSKKP